jgi:methyltransferase (TIGR00027 family)
MKDGQASQTAVLVCMARAAAHGASSEPRFADPTALPLLPDDARARVERHRAGAPPRSMRERAERAFLDRRAKMMVVRTVAIDEAVRAAGAEQVVILGAGLDGRAWRMPELASAVVFEVDHPDSQRAKRAQVAALGQKAREVRFVPVDFHRDRLGDALAAAGHDPARPTVWIWEGVVMYLTPAAVEETLAALAARSAPGSRVVILYTRPALVTHLVGLVVKRLGEPFRSSYTQAAMGALLGRHGYAVRSDASFPELGAASPRDIARAARVMRHLRIVVAERQNAA